MSTMETFKATTKILEGGLSVESSSRNFKVVLDEPKSLGGTDKGMNPVELVLCALGGCQGIVAKAYAKHKGIDLKDFRVELEGDLDVRGFKGDPNVRPGFQEIRFKMYMKTDASPEKVKEFAQFIENTCPVGDSLTNGVSLKLSDVVVEKP
ncbi:OsmC family protein [Fervidibacillus halotolerans]|uniref:OsmC family protein n=1 Tax=Fervidibacillus halotolerans TaxID=2980027 RepID=A0A9E8RY28_9BACI|nr:OsmC family protein [Fervidibacillus halotolerans]WAA13380.1 OsmC family protein [Fervidibacillus halotolerans]